MRTIILLDFFDGTDTTTVVTSSYISHLTNLKADVLKDFSFFQIIFNNIMLMDFGIKISDHTTVMALTDNNTVMLSGNLIDT